VRHRLKVAGCDRPLFKPSALKKIFELTNGYPRLINIVCDHSLLSAFAKDLSDIGSMLVKEAVTDLMHPGQFGEQQPVSPENEPSLAMTPSAGIQPLEATETPEVVNTQKAEHAPPPSHLAPFVLFLQTVLRKPAYLLVAGVLLPALVWFGFWDDPHAKRQASSLSSKKNQINKADAVADPTQSSGYDISIQDSPQGKYLSADSSEGLTQSENINVKESSPSTDHTRPIDAMAEKDVHRSTNQSPASAAAVQKHAKLKPSDVGVSVRTVTAILGNRNMDNEQLPSSSIQLDEIADSNEKVPAADIVDHQARSSAIPIAAVTEATTGPAEIKVEKKSVNTAVPSVLPATTHSTLSASHKNLPDQTTKADLIDEAPLAETSLAEPTASDLASQDTKSDPRALIDFVIKKRTKQTANQ
jgi:hypothetical protein